HSSKSRSLPNDNCTPGDRSPWESCSRLCRDRSHRTKERADCLHTTSQRLLATLPALARRRASTGQQRKATETRETHPANTTARCRFVPRGETETSAPPRRQRACKRRKE